MSQNTHKWEPTYVPPRQAFDAAIQSGLLSKDAKDDNYAGHYMYMFTDKTRGHAFKHRDTRSYVYNGDRK